MTSLLIWDPFSLHDKNFCGHWSSNLSLDQSYVENLLKYKSLGPNSRVSDSVGLEWNSKIGIFNKSPAEADAVGPGIVYFENHYLDSGEW